MLQPTAPPEHIALLSFRGIRKKATEELTPTLLSKIDIRQCQAESSPHIGIAEDERDDEARNEEALKEIAGLDPALGHITPSLGSIDVDRLVDLRNAPIEIHTQVGIVDGLHLRGGRVRAHVLCEGGSHEEH